MPRQLLTGARVITMNGDEVIPNGTIIIDRNRITAIGPSASVAVPSDARLSPQASRTLSAFSEGFAWVKTA